MRTATTTSPLSVVRSSGPAWAAWVLRTALACAFGVAATAIVLAHVGNQLSVRTSIVGGTTFQGLDIYRYLDRFYAATLLFPLCAIEAYVVLRRWGPLAVVPTPRSGPPSLIRFDNLEEPRRRRIGTASDLWAWYELAWGLARLVPPGIAILFEVSAASSPHARVLTRSGLWAAIGYAAFAIASAGILTRVIKSAATDWRDRFGDRLSLVNSLLTPVLLALVVPVSGTTAVTLLTSGRVVHYAWFPWWLGGTVTVLAVAASAAALRRWGDPRDVERVVVLAIAGPVLLLMISVDLPGALGHFTGFDDAQSLVGAQLMFGHGLMPWRDAFLFHGFLSDGLYGAIGMWLFSATRWGSAAGGSMVVTPVSFIVLYGFIVYFSRRRNLAVVAAVLAVMLGLIPGWASARFVLIPVVLILFDRVLRRPTWAWCFGFMLSVVVASITTPEDTILALGVLATLVFAEAVHRRRGEALVVGFRRSLRCLISGLGLLVVWAAFLAATGSLAGFVSYYPNSVSGHELEGALKAVVLSSKHLSVVVYFFLPIVLFLATVAMVVSKLLRRAEWATIDWVLVAAATFVPFIYQVAIDRLDGGHVFEVFQALIPFVLLCGFKMATLADAGLLRVLARDRPLLAHRPRQTVHFAAPVTAFGVIAIAVWSPLSLSTWNRIPGRLHPTVGATAATLGLPFGYLRPGAEKVAEIADLRTVLNYYAGPDGPVFDFTNEMGIVYFLLNRVPGGRYYHIEVALTPGAQRQEIGDLRRSSPRIVIFQQRDFGLSSFDGLSGMERNYLVSEYLLDHYTPLLVVQSQLIMLRNDLIRSAPPLPKLATPVVTTNLYFRALGCNWGDVPNFFVPPPKAEISAGVTPPVAFDRIRPSPTASGTPRTVREIRIAVPPGKRWTDYRWMEFDAPTSFGTAAVTVTDVPGADTPHLMTFNILPRSGEQVFLRVASCIQWHGYPDSHISVIVSGAAPDVSVRLLP